MIRKSFTGRVTVKDASQGLVEAVFSRFDVLDHDGDVTLKGAFTEGAPCVISSWNHGSHGGNLPVGKGTIHENGDVAVMRGKFLMSTPHGRDTFETVKFLSEDGDNLQEWSYSLQDVQAKRGTFNGAPANIISKVGLVKEVSPVLLGAGIDTGTLSTKGRDGKQLMSSLERLLTGEGRARFGWCYVDDVDTDAGFVVFGVETNDGFRLVQVDYTATDTSAELGETETEVHRTAIYLPKSGKFSDHTTGALRAIKGVVGLATERLALRAAEGKSIDEQREALGLLEAALSPLKSAIAQVPTIPTTPPPVGADTGLTPAQRAVLEQAKSLTILTRR